MVCKLLEILATIGKQLLDKRKLQLLRVVLCSFHVDAPLAHQNEIQNSTYIASASWQVVKDYIYIHA